MSDLKLFALESIGKSLGITRVVHTNNRIFILENGEIQMMEVERSAHFDRLIPDEKFNNVTCFDSLFNTYLCIGDNKSMHLYDYRTEKLSSFALTFSYTLGAWSPSQKLVAVITNDKKVKTLKFNLEEANLIDYGENYLSNNTPQHGCISSNWDAKKAHLSRKGSTDICLDSDINLVVDDSPPTIAWRGNSNMFVVNYFVNPKLTRVFKIFSEECNYLFEGMNIIGLQSAVAWKPGLSFYITMPVAKRNKMSIGLFEKSGALSDLFDLRDYLFVSNLEWSTDGSMLGVLQVDNHRSPLSIFLYKNKQWFLKQYLDFMETYKASFFHWVKPESDMLFPICVLTTEGVFKYVFKKDSYISSNLSRDAVTAVATINGTKVELAVFIANVLIPSNTIFQVEVAAPVNNIIFHPDKSQIIIMDSNTTFHLCEYSLGGFNVVRRYEWSEFKNLPFRLHHIFWSMENVLNCVSLGKPDKAFDKLFCGDLSKNNIEEVYFLPTRDVRPNLTFIGYAYGSEVVLEQRHHEITVLVSTSPRQEFMVDYKVLPVSIAAIEIHKTKYIIALTNTNELFINYQPIAKGVNSFIVHGQYLIFTRQTGTLLCLRLKDELFESLISGNINLEESFSLGIPAGATILNTFPYSSEVIIETIKGSYETFKINLILVNKVDYEISHHRWMSAYNFIRDEDLDVNLLYDLNPERFLSDISEIVENLDSPNLINKIINEIANENVLQTKYKYCSYEEIYYDSSFKTQAVSKAFLIYLGNTVLSTKYLSTIVLCCLKVQNLFGLRESIHLISKEFQTFKGKAEILKKNIEEAVKFLKNEYNDVLILKEALMTYNPDAIEAILVALEMHSQFYEVFLEKLRKSDNISMRCLINEHLLDKKFSVTSSIQEKPSIKSFTSKSYDMMSIKNNFNHQALESTKDLLKVAEALEKEYRTIDACRIYEKCLGHLPTTCTMLAKKHDFSGAIKIAKKLKRDNLIESEILPIAESCYGELQQSIDEKRKLYSKQLKDLLRTRIKLISKSDKAITMKNKDLLIKNDTGDKSLPEISSLMEAKSSDTPELEYMEKLKNFHNLVSAIFELKNSVREIISILLHSPNRFYVKCKLLHAALFELHLKILEDIPSIWPSLHESRVRKKHKTEDVESQSQMNLNMNFLKPPNNVSIDWVLPFFVHK